MLLPRENLPLSALDLSQPHGDFPFNRFFESRIKILDLEGRLGSNVLLAHSETNRTTYAIEREGGGLYVLCKLGPWVDMERLSQLATVVCVQRMRNHKPMNVDSGADATPVITPQMHNENKKRRLAIEEIQSKVRRRSVIEKGSLSRPATPTTNPLAPETPSTQQQQEADEDRVGDNPDSKRTAPAEQEGLLQTPFTSESLAPPTADDIFQNIRAQYCETLYHSMVNAGSGLEFVSVLTAIGITGLLC